MQGHPFWTGRETAGNKKNSPSAGLWFSGSFNTIFQKSASLLASPADPASIWQLFWDKFIKDENLIKI